MSKEELKKYRLDHPKEFSFLGTALVSLSSALSVTFVAADHPTWAYITIFLGWIGVTVEKYFQLHEPKKDENNNNPA